MKQNRYGLLTTTSLNGVTVEQFVVWREHSNTAWSSPVPNVPTGPVAPELRWTPDGHAEMRGTQALDDGKWCWKNGNGLQVDFEEIQMQRAPRSVSSPMGDTGLLVMMLTLLVAVGQLNHLIKALIGPTPVTAQAVEPSPELIARLLKKQFGGADDGLVARVERPEAVEALPSFYLPAGSVGPAERVGGGAVAAETIRRRPPGDPTQASKEGSPSNNDSLQGEIEPLLAEAEQAPGIRGLVGQAADNEPVDSGVEPAIERFVGWGFHDWFDVAEAEPEDTQQMTERLELARQLMKIDPDEPYAIMTVAFYAYLSENYVLCRELYAKYIRLYPEDAAGWNNLALTYKRSGEYDEEERLYRMALALEPENSNTRNNLAVNLAHQGRYREAEALMDRLNPAPEEVPYAELHRAKIAAAQGRMRRAKRHLKRALAEVDKMDTFHHIEFRQDIRLDPSLEAMRRRPSVKALLRDRYGDDSPLSIGPSPAQLGGKPHG